MMKGQMSILGSEPFEFNIGKDDIKKIVSESWIKGPENNSENKRRLDRSNPKDVWDLLQIPIGTEMEVHVRREVNKYYVFAIENMEKKCFVSGSRGEGFQFDWSDIDLMSPLLRQTIYMESLHHECTLTAQREGCSPGFCKVFFTNADNNYGTCNSRNIAFQMIQDKWKLELKNISLKIHGPCVQT